MPARSANAARLTRSELRRSLLLLLAVTVVTCIVGALVGTVTLDLAEVWGVAGTDRTIFVSVRLPRVLLAAIVGAALAVAGAALQPTLRNPLASPDIIGVSGGAALAAVFALAVLPAGYGGMGQYLVPMAAFVGAAVASALVYQLSLVHGRLEPYTQILVGVIFNTFAASLILLVSAVVDMSRTHSIVFWLMGGIAVHPYPVLGLVALLVGVGTAVLVREARTLDLLSLGDETAEHLGVDLGASRRRVFAAASLMVGAVVALTGVITFVGLIVPHLMRRILGSDNRLLLPASAFAGAIFLVACDAVARVAIRPAELPVGAITAMVGGPFFIYLLRRRSTAGRDL